MLPASVPPASATRFSADRVRIYTRGNIDDGIECGCDDLKEMAFFPWSTPNSEVAQEVGKAARAVGFPRALPSTGVLYKVIDGNDPPFPGCLEFSDPLMLTKFSQKLRDDQALGAEYATLQIFLPPHYLNCGGSYRRDTAFLHLCAQRITELQRVAHSQGMNFYVETHVDRVSHGILLAAGSVSSTADDFSVSARTESLV